MKRFVLLLLGCIALGGGGRAAEKLQAEMTRSDGRTWKVFLLECGGDQLQYHLDKSEAMKTVLLTEVTRLKFNLPKIDMEALQEQFQQSDYAGVIEVLEPALAHAGDYMIVENNAEEGYELLTRAYLRNRDLEKARSAASKLQLVSNEDFQRSARVVAAQAALLADDVVSAQEMMSAIKDPAAQRFVTALIERKNGESKKAMQIVIEFIATYPNNLEWMPQIEYLCAQLYVDLERLDSAAEVARQAQALYSGMYIEKEAQALGEEIKQVIETSETSE